MKGSIRAIAILLAVAGAIGSVASYKVCTLIFSEIQHTTVAYHIDERLSQDVQRQIIAFVQSHADSAPQQLIDDICAQFGFVENVQLSHTPHAQTLQIQSRPLLALINDQEVATAAGLLFDKNNFSDQSLQNIKRVQVPAEQCTQMLAPVVHDWIERMPADLFASFAVTWVDENAIELKSKNDSQLVIRCSHTQSVDQLCAQACAQAKDEMVQQRSLERHQELVADVRFDRQIIISKR